MQNGFYPRRSGDVMINLMPGWIEERTGVRSSSGSMYRYDTHVPFILFGGGIAAGRYNTEIDMTSMATTLAHLMGINPPSAAEGKILEIK
jgi:arylsulfatase A-like enzyme